MELIFKDIKKEVNKAINIHGSALAKIKLTTEEFTKFKIILGHPTCIIQNRIIYKGTVICK